MLKKTTLFKNIANREIKGNDLKKNFIKKLRVTIKDNKLKFIKLINSNGDYLMKKDEYLFDFTGNNLKNIELVVFDIIDNNLSIKIYNNLSVENFERQQTEYVINNGVETEEIVSSELTCTNILDNKNILTINSIQYNFLFTNKENNTLYYFKIHNENIIKLLKKFFNVESVEFKEIFLPTSSELKKGGKRILKKY